MRDTEKERFIETTSVFNHDINISNCQPISSFLCVLLLSSLQLNAIREHNKSKPPLGRVPSPEHLSDGEDADGNTGDTQSSDTEPVGPGAQVQTFTIDEDGRLGEEIHETPFGERFANERNDEDTESSLYFDTESDAGDITPRTADNPLDAGRGAPARERTQQGTVYDSSQRPDFGYESTDSMEF